MFMEERTEWDVVVKCDHSYDRRCAKTLKTRYEAAQVDKDKTVLVDSQQSKDYSIPFIYSDTTSKY